MIFKTSKTFSKKFDPDRGDGGGDGDDGEVTLTVVTIIPKILLKDITCKGGQSVLLIKIISKNPKCNCVGKIPVQHSPDMIAKIILEKLEKVEKVMYESVTDGSRKALKTGPSEYLEALKELLTELFCGKGLLFSTEKIN